MRNAHKILTRKPEGKRPLGRLRCRWKDTFKMKLKETGCECGDWIRLAQDRVQWLVILNTIMNLRVP
jgi:hypothetical protein